MLGTSGSSVLGTSSLRLSNGLLSSPNNTTNNISHGSTSIGAEDLNSNNVGSLGNTIRTGSDSTGTVGSMAITINIFIVVGHGLAPNGTTFKLDVIDVDTSVDDVDVDTFTAMLVVDVLSESTEREFGSVTDPCKALQVTVSLYDITAICCMTYPRRRPLHFLSTNDLVAFNVINLGHLPNPLHHAVGEHARVPLYMTIIDLADPGFNTVKTEGVGLMRHTQEVEMVLHDTRRHVRLEHNDI